MIIINQIKIYVVKHWNENNTYDVNIQFIDNCTVMNDINIIFINILLYKIGIYYAHNGS